MASPLISRASVDTADPDDAVDGALSLAIATIEHLDATDAGPTGGQRTLLLVNWVLATQANGGLEMTVADIEGPVADTSAALRLLGVDEAAELLDQAERALTAGQDSSALDDAWYELDADRLIAERMLAFVDERPREFFRD